MKYLVIGSEGFLGRALCDLLKKDKNNLIIKADLCFNSNGKDSFPRHIIDLNDADKLISLCRKERPDAVFNLAGAFYSDSVQELFQANCFAPIKFLKAASGLPFRLMLIGSAAEYGITSHGEMIREDFPLNPISDYGISKACQSFMATSIARSNNKPEVIIARPFNMIGAGMQNNLFLGNFAKQIALIEKDDSARKVIKTGNLESYRDILTSEKVADCLIELALKGKHGQAYNICSSKPVKIGDILDKLLKFSKSKIEVDIDKANFKPNDIPWSLGDNEKISKISKISFSEDDLDKSIEQVLDWYRSRI